MIIHCNQEYHASNGRFVEESWIIGLQSRDARSAISAPSWSRSMPCDLCAFRKISSYLLPAAAAVQLVREHVNPNPQRRRPRRSQSPRMTWISSAYAQEASRHLAEIVSLLVGPQYAETTHQCAFTTLVLIRTAHSGEMSIYQLWSFSKRIHTGNIQLTFCERTRVQDFLSL